MNAHRVLGGLAYALGTAIVVAAICGAIVWWLWAMLMWFELVGPLGLLIGLLTISDLVLPFVAHDQLGVWPWAWLALGAGVLVARFVGFILVGFGGTLWEDQLP